MARFRINLVNYCLVQDGRPAYKLRRPKNLFPGDFFVKTLLLSLSFLASTSAFAAPAWVISQVLADAEVAKLTNGLSVTKIEETAAYRCMGCFDFTITQRTPIGIQLIMVGTSANGSDKVSVKVTSVSK